MIDRELGFLFLGVIITLTGVITGFLLAIAASIMQDVLKKEELRLPKEGTD